ncbi:TlpA family protein disulfide reductase [Streptomyces sp. R302]|uniref:TlpA family protein disulfide reductase n=1 Tax=unclassified Streptomyces TaxID=2593676 RepID=UPI00145D5747|nr:MULTISPECIES: TlpA disulfide reductase family protein [unclassified Streptomyces]NML54926.1 TlpA family protein disulfide reductase [Streptomyces sp. R301]NML83613.1 TlpA family protein disulfide reductase [Streptomyces sp. R302]
MSLSRGLRPASRRALAAVGALSAALALSACGGDDNGTSGGGNTNFVTSKGGISTVPRGERTGINQIAGETLEGEKLDVAELKGKVVVLNVWGSWCGPCRAEAPHFAKAATDLKGEDVAFVGLNTRDANKQQALAFEDEYKIPYPSLYDRDGKLILFGFPKGTLSPKGIPSTVVLDKEGKIAARALMAVDEAKLRSMIDPLLKEK